LHPGTLPQRARARPPALDLRLDTAAACQYNRPARLDLLSLKEHRMDNAKWTFGLTMMIVGMGGTFLTLWILSLVMDTLKKIFPLASKAGSAEKQ
jgi:hypothetical protein